VTLERSSAGSTITVRDRGQGVLPEHVAKIFDSFFSTKPRGMGLGLSIARTIVEAHDGRIWAETNVAEGAVFCVQFPVADTVAAPVLA